MVKRQIRIELDKEMAKEFDNVKEETGMPVSRQIELKLKGFIIVKDKKTAIQLSTKTVECLKKLGNKGDTYDDIIKRLIYEVHPELRICFIDVGGRLQWK